MGEAVRVVVLGTGRMGSAIAELLLEKPSLTLVGAFGRRREREGTGLFYGHTFRTRRPSLVATLPVGYGDGRHRSLSNRMEVLVRGVRCPQVGTIAMDQTLVDVTALRGQAELGDEVVLIGRQGDQTVSATALTETLGTIHYEVVTAIARRVPRLASGGADDLPGSRG